MLSPETLSSDTDERSRARVLLSRISNCLSAAPRSRTRNERALSLGGYSLMGANAGFAVVAPSEHRVMPQIWNGSAKGSPTHEPRRVNLD